MNWNVTDEPVNESGTALGPHTLGSRAKLPLMLPLPPILLRRHWPYLLCVQ